MKNLAKLLVMALLVGLFGVVAISSLLATPTVQTPLVATTSYNVETGIRWNEGFGVFEVFNAAGFSYIGSGKLIDESGTLGLGEATTGDKTYHIMQDIAYDETSLEGSFKAGARHSITQGGAIKGRGFTLKNFPIMTGEGTALFKKNEGTIQGLTLVNPIHTEGTSGSVGIICYENNNVIDNCIVTGGKIYTNDALNIAAIAYKGSGTIRSCINELSIKTEGQYAAGIVANANGAIIYDCKNVASIESTASNSIVGGIASTIAAGRVLNNSNYGDIAANDAGGVLGNCLNSEVKSNKNFGTITGTATACGIIGGRVVTIDEEDNFHYGTIVRVNGDETASDDNYLPEGSTPVPVDTFGIKYDPIADTFLIENKIGLSYLGSEQRFDYLGSKVEEGTPYSAVASKTNATYIITENIDYDSVEDSSSELFTNMPLVIGRGTVVDGGNKELTNFRIRPISKVNSFSALFESIGNGAEVRNIKLSLAVDPSKEDGSTFIPSGDTLGSIGILSHSNDGTIRDSEVSGRINTTLPRNVGGIAYNNTDANVGTRFINCTNKATILTKAERVGGIAATVGTTTTTAIVEFDGCVNEGDLTMDSQASSAYFGGIVGFVSMLKMTNCENKKTITMTGSGAGNQVFSGGLVGQAVSAYVRSCTNSGPLYHSRKSSANNLTAAGLVAWVTDVIVMVDCTNTATGKIISELEDSQPRIGGVLGFARSRGSFLTTTGSEELGISFEHSTGTVLLNCVNYAEIRLKSSKLSETRPVGGVAGDFELSDRTEPLSFVHCKNFGEFILEDYESTTLLSRNLNVGGIVGRLNVPSDSAQPVTFNSCSNTKDISVTLKGSYLGGILGSAGGSFLNLISINNTFSGTVTAPTDAQFETGVFAGRVVNTSLTSLSCSGGGTASSNRYVGNIEASGPVIPVSEPETPEAP